ncbi:MAG: DHH family phosphoesterase, partial [Syntrophales bacterium LBB04]|nr:DHH family phosphoesterase [Syntrophales bacterium LBB04]
MKRIKSLLIKDETLKNVKRLLSIARGIDNMAILIHGSPDPDSIAAAMALREIFRQKSTLKTCAILSTETAVRQQNVELIRSLKLDIPLLGGIDLGGYPLIAMLDAQPPFFGKSLGDSRPRIVIDHHPRAAGWLAELEDIREDYGALSTILMEYLLAAKVRIPKILYTALAHGILTDTNHFERDTLIEDIGAYQLAFTRANRELLRRIEFNQIPERFLKYFDYAYHHQRRYRDRVVCYLGKVESLDACVQVADFYLRLIDIYYVAVAGLVKDRLIIILRGDGSRQDCAVIAGKAFGSYGSAGGHKS